MNRILAALVLVGAVSGVVGADAKQKPTFLNIGDPAPALKVSKWVKGEPVTLKKGEVAVVEFWATWCGPCRQSIPHLTELAKKYEGKVAVAGISVWEGKDEKEEAILENVEKFVKGMGKKMDYSVGVDTSAGFMAKNWMEAALEGGIPAAFIIGKDGNIAWIGHPLEGMDKVLEQVLEGKFDSTALAAARRKVKEGEAVEKSLLAQLRELVGGNKHKEALAAIDAVGTDHPEIAKKLGVLRVRLLLETDEAAAYALAKKLGDEEGIKNNPSALYMLAKSIVEPNAKRKNPDYGVAVALAAKANEVTEGKEPFVLALLAEAHSRKGDAAKAIEFQEKAVKQLEDKPGAPEAAKKQLKAKLDEYKKAAEGK